MSAAADRGEELAAAVAAAYAARRPLAIIGGASKRFLGEPGAPAAPLDVRAHRGVIAYEPGELVLTARAGTPLAEIEATLAASDQALPFEPPHFADSATLGGTVAAGVSGPARPYAGAVRDFVLGVRIINGRGEILRFGGEVMKNVAGYDLSRLMAGAFGTLGVLLDISLKVLPRARAEYTLALEHDAGAAIAEFSRLRRRPWPVTGAYWEDGRSYLRLAGAEASVASARAAIGGEAVADAAAFWGDVGELTRPALAGAPLWRLSLPPATPPLDLDGLRPIDWGGAQRWRLSERPAERLRAVVGARGGHATLYRGPGENRLHPLPPALFILQKRLKASLDPGHILNPDRMYAGL